MLVLVSACNSSTPMVSSSSSSRRNSSRAFGPLSPRRIGRYRHDRSVRRRAERLQQGRCCRRSGSAKGSVAKWRRRASQSRSRRTRWRSDNSRAALRRDSALQAAPSSSRTQAGLRRRHMRLRTMTTKLAAQQPETAWPPQRHYSFASHAKGQLHRSCFVGESGT